MIRSLLFQKITPLYAVGVAALVYLMVHYFLSGIDYTVLGFAVGYLMLLAVVIAADRFLVSRLACKKLFIVELALLIVGAVSYLYAISTTMINVETGKPYFFVVYDDAGLKSAEIPTVKWFNKALTITGDSTIHIDRSLEYTAQINPPEPWRYAYNSKKQEAIVAGKAVTVAIYAKDLYDQALDTALKAEIERLEQKR